MTKPDPLYPAQLILPDYAVVAGPGELPEDLPWLVYPSQTTRAFGQRLPAIVMFPLFHAVTEDKTGQYNPTPYILSREGWHLVTSGQPHPVIPEELPEARDRGWKVRAFGGQVEIGRPGKMMRRVPFTPFSNWLTDPPAMVVVLAHEDEIVPTSGAEILAHTHTLTGAYALLPLELTP